MTESAAESTAASSSDASTSTTTTDTTSRSIGGRIWARLTGDGSFSGYVRLFVIVILVIYAALFLFAFVQALINAQGAADFFDYIRDLITIAISLTGILIVVGTGIILAQIGRFVNLLRSEVKPITQDAQEAAKNVRTTTEFVQKQAVEPIIRTTGFLSGVVAFLREIVKLSRLFRRRDRASKSQEATDTDE